MILCVVLSPKHIAFASSNYVLPYPSAMPGSKLYHAHILWDKLMNYWYFGSLSQFRYNREQSDKYLVEAKTLFEYKQYLLAENALKKSNRYLNYAKRDLESAKAEQKDIRNKKSKFREAAKKHIEVLESVKLQVPESFLWQPEKAKPSTLSIWDDIDEAVEIRQLCL